MMMQEEKADKSRTRVTKISLQYKDKKVTFITGDASFALLRLAFSPSGLSVLDATLSALAPLLKVRVMLRKMKRMNDNMTKEHDH